MTTNHNQSLYLCHDTYKAAYLMIHGAKIEQVQIRPYVEYKAKKKYHREEWSFLMSNAPTEHIELARIGQAVCNIEDLKDMRFKIKRMIKKARVERPMV